MSAQGGSDPVLIRYLTTFFEQGSDPWDRLAVDCAPETFGLGSRRRFVEYFRGTSRVPVRTFDDICNWLRGCECVADEALFLEADYWQHPLTFEQLRKGDCEDHALWAWRKLSELGVAALFVSGRWRGVAHTWIVLTQGDLDHLLETTSKTGSMIQPLRAVGTEYCPALAIDTQLRTWVFRGFRTCHEHHGGLR
jgi:hypothetical protein